LSTIEMVDGMQVQGPKVEQVTRGPRQHFFGYYDKCPWDATGRFLLVMETDVFDGLPDGSHRAVVGIADLEEGNRFFPLAETKAWNWQQGAMLQWLPSSPDRHIIYNDRENDAFISIILDIQSGNRRVLPRPVYAVSPCDDFALGLDYTRLHVLRANYGYAGIPAGRKLHSCPQDDGVYWLDLVSGDSRLILSIEEAASFGSGGMTHAGSHTVEHLTISPDGRRFCFHHRIILPGGDLFNRLMTADIDGSNICLLEEGFISHFCWFDSSRLIAWSRPKVLGSNLRHCGVFSKLPFRWILDWGRKKTRGFIRQRIIGDRYCLFADGSGERDSIGVGILDADGHPTCSPDKKWMLTDTYPGEKGNRTLILYNFETNKRINVGTFYSHPGYAGTTNCDLHPRWSRDGSKICFDSTHEGIRQVYIVNVEEIIR